ASLYLLQMELLPALGSNGTSVTVAPGRISPDSDLNSKELTDTKSPVPFPVFLPVNYEVRDADYLFLKEAGQDFMRNSSMQSHTQPFVLLRASRQPAVNASYGPVSTERLVPLDLVQSVQLFNAPDVFTFNWKIQAFVLTPRVFSSKPKVRVLFYVAGRDWARSEGALDELPCVTVYAFWQTQEVRGSCAIGGERGTCMAELLPEPGWFAVGSEGTSRERQDPSAGNSVELYYQAQPRVNGKCFSVNGSRWSSSAPPAEYVPVTPMQRIGSVQLLQIPKGMATLSRLKLGNAIVIRTSSKPLKKTDIATFYILMASSAQLTNFTLRYSCVCSCFKCHTEILVLFSIHINNVITEVQVPLVYFIKKKIFNFFYKKKNIKVSDRCDYVFVNGKETKGKVKMVVNFSYSYLSAQLELNVWMPQLPLQIELSDTELSQIKSWRVPILTSKSEEAERKGKGCMLQLQHALVRVLTHFVAEQEDPRDPTAYFLGSDWQVDITRLVRYFMKVEDPRVARLQEGRVLSGRDFGTTNIQVFSPLSDVILAKTTVKVVDDKVSITELGVQVVSGLSMMLQRSSGSSRAILATTTTQEVLQSPKQEALVSSWVQFSDGNQTPLDIYDPANYRLTVTSLDQGVVSVQGRPPLVVAEGEGEGVLVRVEMSICESCQKSKRKSTVAVDRSSVGNKDSNNDYGNDGEEMDVERKQRRPSQFLPSSIPNSNKEERPENTAPGNLVNYNDFPTKVEIPRPKMPEVESGEEALANRPLTDLEIGMYALLGVFCLAILVFLVNCISYVVKFRHKKPPSHGQEPTGHRHDWVWLGTDAELVMTVPCSPVQQDSHTATTVIDIGPDKTASLSRRPSCLASITNSPLSCASSHRTKPIQSESLHSPTSKRKRVQFTTFSTLERQHSPHLSPKENGHGIHWVGKEERSGEEPQVPIIKPGDQL
uniref:Transmembrane protein 132D n=1 Tax=Xiphophorus couchianus TaxID=32473 RepID=A0A3B5MHI4_9TELE